jgi:hypothetical protein
VTADEVLTRLDRIRQTREVNEAEEQEAVLEARRLGLSWQVIADHLGRRVSSVWEKYHDLG